MTRGGRLAPWTAVLILAVAGWWRFHDLGRWSLDGDEIYSWYDAQRILAGEEWPFGARSHPLVYLVMSLHVWLLGLSEWALRLGPALLGFLAVPALLFLRRDVIPQRAALMAGALAALSPWLVFHAQNARFYGPQLLFSALAILCVLPGPRRRAWAAGGAWIAAVLCHPTALLLGPALAVSLLSRPARWRRLFGLAGVLAAALFVVYLTDDGALEEVALRVLEKRDPGKYDPLHFVAGLGYNVGPLIGLLAALALPKAFRERDGAGWTLAASAAAGPGVLLVLALAGLSMHQRYAMCSIPAAMLLAGRAWDELMHRKPAIGLVLGGLALLAPAPMLLAYSRDGNRHDMHGVASFLAEVGSPEDIFIVDEHVSVELYLHEEPGFADSGTVEEAPLLPRKQRPFLSNRREVWVAVKASRLEAAYGAEFKQWLDDYFIEIRRIGRAPPPMVRHDNRYVILRRKERLRSP